LLPKKAALLETRLSDKTRDAFRDPLKASDMARDRIR